MAKKEKKTAVPLANGNQLFRGNTSNTFHPADP